MDKPILKNYPFVSIIFPCWNHKEDTIECLESLEKLDYPKNKLEIIIADNGSTDGSQGVIKKKFEQMKSQGWSRLLLIENDENLGHSAGTNRAYEKISPNAKYILKLDNDVVVSSNSLIKSVETIEKDKQIGVVGGKIFYYNKPNILAMGCGYINFFNFLNKKNKNNNKNLNNKNLINCDFVCGCYSLIKKICINSHFLDENFFVYYDDIDFCLKIKNKGWKIIYSPDIKIYHKISTTTNRKTRSKFALYYGMRNKLLLEKKNAKFYHKIIFYPLFAFIQIPELILGKLIHKRQQEIPICLKAIKDFLFKKWGKQKI